MSPMKHKHHTATADSSNSLTHLIREQEQANQPIGIKIFGTCFRFKSQASKRSYHQGLVLLLTFIAYTAFHMSRRPLSVVKNVLNRDCSLVKLSKNITDSFLDESATTILIDQHYGQSPDFQQHHGGNVILTQDQLTPAISSNTYPNDNYDYDNFASTTTTNPLTDQSGSLAHQLLLNSSSSSSINSTAAPIVTSTSLPPKDTSCDWAPFNDDTTANKLLAYLDTSFLLSYATFMFFSGFIAERTNLRYFITLGSLISGLGLIAFGLSYSLDIHSMSYFVLVQIISGAAQTTGWPVVVTCVSNWFDRNRLGTIYGLWNSHTSFGNILGAAIAGYYVESDWGLSFIVPGALMIALAILLFLFLVPAPHDVYLAKLDSKTTDGQVSSSEEYGTGRQARHSGSNGNKIDRASISSSGSGEAHLSPAAGGSTLSANDKRQSKRDAHGDPNRAEGVNLSSDSSSGGGAIATTLAKGSAARDDDKHGGAAAAAAGSSTEPISFMKALRIPGVIEYSFCLYFSKLVSYTFLYWLPRYIKSSTSFNSRDSAYLSTPFDMGGVAGSILAGWLSDRFKVNALICNIMFILAIPSMLIYQQYGAHSSLHNILLQLLVGSMVNGPYCLITTAVSADLGTRIKDGHAMATVSAIIDGMGSLGAVLGPLFAGFVSSNDWRSVFFMLMMAEVLASLCIVRITVQDVRAKLLGTRPATAPTATTAESQSGSAGAQA